MARRKRKPTTGPFLKYIEVLRDRIASPDKYPYSLPAFHNLDQLPFHPHVTFFVGENGTGKSTLLEAIAILCELNPEGGSRHFTFATCATHSDLHDSLRIARIGASPRDSYFLRAESFYNVSTEVDKLFPTIEERLPAYGSLSLHQQSHGESFFALFSERLRRPGLYLMDEPEAALSPKRQLEFLALLHQYCNQGSQFIIATHSPIIMAYPDACIYVFGAQGLQETPYLETEHYRVTRGFLSNPASNLEILMADEPP